MHASTKRPDGSVTLRRGKYRARVSYNKERVSLGDFAAEQDAWDAIAAFWVEVAKAQPEETTGVLTLKRWGEIYLDKRETDGVHRAIDQERNRWDVRIARSSLGQAHIDTLTTREVRAWLAKMIKTPTGRGTLPARSTIANTLNLLRVALEDAVQSGILESNPARDVRMPRIATTTEGWDWLRANEVEQLLASRKLLGEQRRIFTVALLTGLRKGELWGLRWANVDLQRGELLVSESYERKATKGGKPRRVPLLKPALEALKKQPRRCALVFPTPDLRTRHRNDSAGWFEFLAEAQLRRVRFHDIRHTCASHLLMGTWAPELMERPLRLEELQKWLGHKNVQTTQRYAHLCDGILDQVVRGQKAAGPTAGPSWTHAEDVIAADVMQLAAFATKSLEVQMGLEPTLTVLQGGIETNTSASFDSSGPVLDRVGSVLRCFAAGGRPDDVSLVQVLIAAAERIQKLETAPADRQAGVA